MWSTKQEGGDLLGAELLGAQWQANQRATQDSSGWLYRSNGVVWFVDKGAKTDLSGKSDRWGKIELAGDLRDDTVAGLLPLEKAEKSRKCG